MAFIVVLGREGRTWCALQISRRQHTVVWASPLYNKILTCMWCNSADILFIRAQLAANRNEFNCDNSLVLYTPSIWTSV